MKSPILEYVCVCACVTEQEIVQSISDGNNTIDKIRNDTNACICCEQCYHEIIALLDTE